jgi:hypothetical protein
MRFSTYGPAGCHGSLSRNLIVVLCGGAVLLAPSAHAQPMLRAFLRRRCRPRLPSRRFRHPQATCRPTEDQPCPVPSLDGPPPGGLTLQERLQAQSGQKLLRHHRAPAGATPVEPSRDLTQWNMFWPADIIVKMVMLGLAFTSVLTWTIWFAKTVGLVAARRCLSRRQQTIATARSLAQANPPDQRDATCRKIRRLNVG